MNCVPWRRSYEVIPENLSGEEAVALLKAAPSNFDQMLQVLRARRKASPRRGRRLMRAVLRSPMTRLAGLAMQYAAKGKKPLTTDVALKLVHMSKFLSPWKNTGEVVKHFKPKDQTAEKERWVYDIGFERGALSKVLKCIAAAMTDLHPDQFISAGGGPAFERWYLKVQPDAAVFLTTDIPSCYDRVLRPDIGSPLPGAVLTSQLYTPMDQAKTFVTSLSNPNKLVLGDDAQSAFKSSGERGIPQGAALASIQSEIAIAKVLAAIEAACPNARVAAHGDNIIVALKSEADEPSVIHALKSAVTEHFGADTLPELLSRLKNSAGNEPLRFCGRIYRRQKGKLQIIMQDDRIEKWLARFADRIEEIDSKEKFDNARKSMLGFLKSAGIHPNTLCAYDVARKMLDTVNISETQPN